MRARKICSDPLCANIQPCSAHAPKPWQGSRAKRSKLSGSKQQKRAQYILRKYDTICHVCNRPGGTEADHVIPLAENGPDTRANMRPIHGGPDSCHSRKTAEEAHRGRKRAA